MLRAETQFDPIVEILRLAYRRGLNIQRQQQGSAKAVSERNMLKPEQEDNSTELELREAQAKVGK